MWIRGHGNALILEPLNSNWLWLDNLEALDTDSSDAATEKPARLQVCAFHR